MAFLGARRLDSIMLAQEVRAHEAIAWHVSWVWGFNSRQYTLNRLATRSGCLGVSVWMFDSARFIRFRRAPENWLDWHVPSGERT